MGGGKRKRKDRQNPSNKINRSTRVQTKDFEVFVTDFLTDPCGLPVEWRDYILVDGISPIIDTPDTCTSQNSQVLKKILGNIEQKAKNAASLLIEEPSKKTNEFDQRIHL